MEFVSANASRKAYEYLQENTSSITPEELNTTLKKATAAPVLANAALLAANGCTTTFITVVSALYMSNDLPLPDFSELQNISNFQMGNKDKSTCHFQSKTKDTETSLDTVDFTGINEELKVFNNNFYTITETSPPDWEDWFDENNHSNISYHPLKAGSLSSGISVTSLTSTSSVDVSKTNAVGQYTNKSCNVSMINPPYRSLRHSSSSGISVASFASSSESLDIPNITQPSKLPFSSTPLPTDLRAALSPIKLALVHSLKHDKKRSSLSPKGTLDLNTLHRHILSSKMAESSNFRYSQWNHVSLSPRKHLTPFTTPSDVPRHLPSSNIPISLTPLTTNVDSISVTQDSFKTTNSKLFDSTKGIVPITKHTAYDSPSSFKSGTFDLTTDTTTSPWVVVRSHGIIDSDPNITKDSRKHSFENAAKKMWQQCRTQLF